MLRTLETIPGLVLVAVVLIPVRPVLAQQPDASAAGNLLRVNTWPPVAIEVDSALSYAGSRRFRLYDVSRAEIHVYLEADRDSVVQRLYWFQLEDVLPTSDHRYDYSDLPRSFERAGLRFVADARHGTGYSLETVDREGDTAEMLGLLADAGYSMPPQMMRLRAVTLDETGRRELLFIYLESLSRRGLSAAELDDESTWQDEADRLQARALEGLTIRRRR